MGRRLFARLFTVLWGLWYLLFMLFCLLAFPFFRLTKLFLSRDGYRRLIFRCASFWGRATVRSTGSRVRIDGLERIPAHPRLCFIGNHQGLFDIPAFLGYLGRPVGFIAKQELFKVPVLSHWMREIPCVFIDRNSARKAMESFKQSAEVIRQGHPQVIFPEGTRSKGDTLGEFHLGSLKLPAMAEAAIVPFVIKGSWRCFEADGSIHPARIRIMILDPVFPESETYRDKNALSEHLRQIIGTALEEL
jgi:1-acyl-sn-glycerol-3-phosphate acyltransferase